MSTAQHAAPSPPEATPSATPFNTWAESAPRLVSVAAGRSPADLVIRGGKVVNVQSREVLDGWEVAVAAGRFAYVGPDAGQCIGVQTEVIDAGGRYVIPGLCDGHMHIESGMLTPAEFSAAVIPHGTTTIFTDPHEIANVLGLEGVRMMHDEALLQPMNIFTQMPSCAPSAPGLENTGFEISPEDVAEAMGWPGIIGLGEMMNFPGVINGDPQGGKSYEAVLDCWAKFFIHACLPIYYVRNLGGLLACVAALVEKLPLVEHLPFFQLEVDLGLGWQR